MKKAILMTLAVLLIAGGAYATDYSFGWENTVGTIIGSANTTGANIWTASVAGDQVHSGNKSLKLTSGGVVAQYNYLGWVKGLNVGDIVTASIWVYDLTPSGNPSGRIWAHYNDSATDVLANNGSASGNSTYSGATSWTQLSYSWTIATPHTGLMIEARTYAGAAGSDVWVDDLSVTTPANASVTFVPEPGSLLALCSGLVGLYGFILRKKTA